MSELLLRCGPCNVRFRAKLYAANRTYKCPKCGRRLKAVGVSASASRPSGGIEALGPAEEQAYPNGRSKSVTADQARASLDQQAL